MWLCGLLWERGPPATVRDIKKEKREKGVPASRSALGEFRYQRGMAMERGGAGIWIPKPAPHPWPVYTPHAGLLGLTQTAMPQIILKND